MSAKAAASAAARRRDRRQSGEGADCDGADASVLEEARSPPPSAEAAQDPDPARGSDVAGLSARGRARCRARRLGPSELGRTPRAPRPDGRRCRGRASSVRPAARAADALRRARSALRRRCLHRRPRAARRFAVRAHGGEAPRGGPPPGRTLSPRRHLRERVPARARELPPRAPRGTGIRNEASRPLRGRDPARSRAPDARWCSDRAPCAAARRRSAPPWRPRGADPPATERR